MVKWGWWGYHVMPLQGFSPKKYLQGPVNNFVPSTSNKHKQLLTHLGLQLQAGHAPNFDPSTGLGLVLPWSLGAPASILVKTSFTGLRPSESGIMT